MTSHALAPIIACGLLGAGLAYTVFVLKGQQTPEVQPSAIGQSLRLAYHLLLIGFIAIAIIVDLDCYLIPDSITFAGTILGIGLAVAWPEMQLVHLWVDWNEQIPYLQGPYIPAWLDQYRTLHALSWTLTGALVGAGLTLIVRFISQLCLGTEAMGLGDVTLMAMIGSFIGWQPVVCAFAIAPLTGLIQAALLKVIFGRAIVPYGPCLGIAAIVVLFSWRNLWLATRTVFGDPISLLLLTSIALVSLVVLLFLLRLYRSIPGKSS
jgi:leader peptidase (prepilin peptidase) / N-methyltransferase